METPNLVFTNLNLRKRFVHSLEVIFDFDEKASMHILEDEKAFYRIKFNIANKPYDWSGQK